MTTMKKNLKCRTSRYCVNLLLNICCVMIIMRKPNVIVVLVVLVTSEYYLVAILDFLFTDC